MATIGRNRAVVDIGHFHLRGAGVAGGDIVRPPGVPLAQECATELCIGQLDVGILHLSSGLEGWSTRPDQATRSGLMWDPNERDLSLGKFMCRPLPIRRLSANVSPKWYGVTTKYSLSTMPPASPRRPCLCSRTLFSMPAPNCRRAI